MKNKIMIAVVVLINGCAQTPPRSPVEEYWFNRNKAEAESTPVKVESNQNAASVKTEASPQANSVMTAAEIARSKEYDKANKECQYEASKATVGMYDVDDPYKALDKRIAEIELVKQCLSVKGF